MEDWERLLEELRAELLLRERELELLHKIDLRLLAPEKGPSDKLLVQDIFGFIVNETRQLLQANHTTILLRRSTFLEPMYSNTKSVIGQRVPIARSITGRCLESNTIINVADVTEDPVGEIYAPLRGYDGPPLVSLLATPIRVDKTVIGVLNAESTRPGAFRPVHERIATAIAAQVSIALQQTQTLASNVLFADLDRLLLASTDSQQAIEQSQYAIQTALERVMEELQRQEHIEHTGAQIMLVRGDQDVLDIVHSTNVSDVGLTLPIDNSVCGRAVRTRETVIVADVNEDPEYQRMLGSSIQSEIAVPILAGDTDDLAIGVLNVESADRNAFSDFYRVVLESFAGKLRTLLTLVKLRTDLVAALELRSADDVLVAVGDQTTHLIHRLNNTVGAMRIQIMELQSMQASDQLSQAVLTDELASLLSLAERALKMPEEVTRLLGQDGTSVDVNAYVRDAIGKLEQRPGLEIELNLTDNIPTLSLYSFDIVVQNLIQNAIDAMPDGGKLSINSSAIFHPTLPTGYLQLSISDTGTGIPADVQQRMFELNFTTKDARGKGLGLGLWWVRNFVRRAKGDIVIKSELGTGTEVLVKIPFDQERPIT